MKALAPLLLIFISALNAIAAPEAQLGGVLRHGDTYEISIIYSEPVDVPSMGNPENYSAPPGNLIGLRLCATNQGVVLTVTGLSPGSKGFVNIANVLDTAGNAIQTTPLPFTALDRFWAIIGANELGFPPDVVSFPEEGYDVFSGGVQQRDEYDDATFVGEQSGEYFEAKVRVEYIDPAGAGAKAGIMIREQLDENKPRPLDPDDPTQAFSRYVELAIAAPQSIFGEPDSAHHIWQRAVFGSLETLSLTVTNDDAPAFPRAWLRVERVGSTFLMSRSAEGIIWERIGSATFDPPLSTNVYVGLAFSPQNDDIPGSTDLRKSFVAKFRDYKLTPKNPPDLRIEKIADHAEVSWSSGWILETATDVTGPWGNASSQQSPLRIELNERMRFFRVRALLQ